MNTTAPPPTYPSFPYSSQPYTPEEMYHQSTYSEQAHSHAHSQYPVTNGYSAGAYYDGPAAQVWDTGYQYPAPHQINTFQDQDQDQDQGSPDSDVSYTPSPIKKSSSNSQENKNEEPVAAPKKRGRKKKVINEAERAIKREHFLERNRIAAGKCRQGKKVQNELLRKKEQELRDMNQVLQFEVADLRAQKSQWLEHWRAHMLECHGEVVTPQMLAEIGVLKIDPALGASTNSNASTPQSASSPESQGGVGMSRSQSDQSTQLTELSPPEAHTELGFVAQSANLFESNLNDLEMGDYFDFPPCPSPMP